MFWIQETGTNKNNSNYRYFYAETQNDIENFMPTHEKEGTQENGDSVANKKCAIGSECLCLENGGSFWVLRPSGWKAVE